MKKLRRHHESDQPVAGTPLPTLPSVAQARKYFYDWLDKNRPWASGNGNAYELMEKMVDAAAEAFRNDHRPTKWEMRKLENSLMRFTEKMDDHPVGYEGPCMCAECRRDA